MFKVWGYWGNFPLFLKFSNIFNYPTFSVFFSFVCVLHAFFVF